MLATATFVLAGTSFWTIRQNYKFREKDRKERLLTEIIAWTVDVGKYMLSRNLPLFEKHFTKDGTYFGEYLDDSTQDSVIAEYTKFRIQSVYVTEISKDFPEIRNLIADAIKHLRRELRLLNRYTEKRNYDRICEKSGEEKAGCNIARNEDRLYNSVVEIIQTIGTIKSLN